MLPSSIRGGLLVLLLVATCAYAQKAEAAEEETAVDENSGIPPGVNCGDGLIIPIWRPYDNLSGK